MSERRTEIIDNWFKNHKATRSVLRGGDGKESELLVWGEPETMNCRIYYMRYGSVLMVFGDLGSATYQWHGNNISLRWISNCSLDYFAGKCQASEEGRRYEVWNEDVARECIENDIAEQQAEAYEYNGLEHDEEKEVFDEAARRLMEELKKAGAAEALKDNQLWDEFVVQHPQHFGGQGTWLSSEMDGCFKLEDIVQELVAEGTYTQEVAKARWLKKFMDAGGYHALASAHEYTCWANEYGEDILGADFWEYGMIGNELAIRCEGHLVGLKKAFAYLDAQKEAAGDGEAKEEAAQEV